MCVCIYVCIHAGMYVRVCTYLMQKQLQCKKGAAK